MATVLMTGGHKGLGLEAARHIAERGFDLLLAGRSPSEIEEIAASLGRDYAVNIRALKLDVSSLQSVRDAAAEVKELLRSQDIGSLQTVMCNAGIQKLRGTSYSVDNYEQTFATNCLGHFLLVNLLLDVIDREGRIVFTASGTHDPATMDGKLVGAALKPDAIALAHDGKAGKPISGGKRYTTSKLCTIMYSYELERRLNASGVNLSSIAFDPGLIAETGLSRSAPDLVQKAMRTSLAKWAFKRMGVAMGSLSFSGNTLAKIAVDPAYRSAGGKYLQSDNGKLIERRSSEDSYDKVAAEKLWEDSERLVHLSAEEKPERLRAHGPERGAANAIRA